jgi:hypothetical protein
MTNAAKTKLDTTVKIIMIDEYKYLQIVSETKADISPFFDLAISQKNFRDILVKHLIDNNSINIYYHSYLILNEATKSEPSLFYCYWDKFSLLLQYDNSYHRNYGMDLIANLIAVDKDNNFDLIINDYYKQLYDEKVSTIKYCISNSATIIKYKPQLTTIIFSKIIDSLRISDNSDRHQNFLISEFLQLLTSIDNKTLDMTAVNRFLKDVLTNTKSEKIKREIYKYGTQHTI